jgi:hypothetical protein
MAYLRRVVLLGPGGRAFKADLSQRAGAGCWFELHRQGGCGAGELVLNDRFAERGEVEVGDWVAYEPEDGVRWYLGRVEERRASSPAVVRYRLAGMSTQLSEVFPGGFAREVADGVPPHLLARTDGWFAGDPDQSDATFDVVSGVNDVVDLLLRGYVVPKTDIAYDAARVESVAGPVWSVKFRGEETAQSILKELATRARDASWGVDETGTFFLVAKRTGTAVTVREGREVLSLAGVTDWELLVNRVLLTGDFVYEEEASSGAVGRRFSRWRGNYLQPASREKYGDRRLKMWVPWIRRREDAVTFLREFFRVYAEPGEKYLVEAKVEGELVRPWEGRVRVEDRAGDELLTAVVNTVRVEFDHVPVMRLELGPEDPRSLWPESAVEERYEIPRPEERRPGWGGDQITLTSSEQTLTTFSSSGEPSTGGSSSLSSTLSSTMSSSSGGSSSSVESSSVGSSSLSSSMGSSSLSSESDLSSEESATSSAGSSSDVSSEQSGSSLSSGMSSSESGASSSASLSESDLESSGSEAGSSSGNGSSEVTSDELSSEGESSSAGSEITSDVGSSGSDSDGSGTTSESDASSGSDSASGSDASSGGSDSSGGSTASDDSGGSPGGDSDSGSDGDGSDGGGSNSGDDGSLSGGTSSASSSESSEASSSAEGSSSSGNESSSGGDSSSGGTSGSGGGSSSSSEADGCVWRWVQVGPVGIWIQVRKTCPNNGPCVAPGRNGEFAGEELFTPCA